MIGILEYWNNGIMEYWSIGVLEDCPVGMPMAEYWNL
jgi:hypothetical protein